MYVNSNKGWLDDTRIEFDEKKLAWNGKARKDKEYDWVIYNNALTEGYTPEVDIRPLKPFKLTVNISGKEDATVKITTVNGDFEFQPASLSFGEDVHFLNDLVSIQRVYPARKITDMGYISERYKYHGFPAATSTSDGKTYVAYSTYYEGISPYRWHQYKEEIPSNFDYLAQEADGDRLNILIEENGNVIQKFPVTTKGKDIFDIAMATKDDNIWVAWSEKVEGNQDIYFTKISGDKVGEISRLTNAAGPDIHPALTSNENGVWIAWQGYREGSFDILYANLLEPSKQKIAGKTSANEWEPSIASDSKGNIAIAWDTYTKGDYDVYYALINKDEKVEKEGHVAASLDFEARPSLVFDNEDRLWVAYELAGKNWGKDNGSHYFIKNVEETEGLFERRSIRVVCIDNGEFYTTKVPVHEVIPREKRYTFFYNKGAKPKGYEIAQTPNHYLNYPVLDKDKNGNIVLVYKKNPDLDKGLSGTTQWWSYLMSFNGKKWSEPVLLYGSYSQMHEKPAIITVPGAGIKVVHAADRQKNMLAENPDQFSQNLWMAYPEIDGDTYPFELEKLPNPTIAKKPASVLKEETDLQVIREYRTENKGKTYRILKGDSHRHSSFSGDGGGDSQIEDSYRYALDASGLDWFSNGDHDNGYNEYYWNLTQKYTDIFHVDDYHTSLFGYERSNGFPNGHRNVLFTQRGIRMLPRVKYDKSIHPNSSPDVRLLYNYLEQFDGICISHTSATKTAGTDWRELDTDPEPVIEIYQGERMSAECATCPRFNPNIPYHPVNEDGFYRKALEQGHRLGIISSSDHRSTHVSFAMVYTEEFSREGIMEGLKKKRTYGATDNIVLDVRMDGAMMGEVIKSNKREINIQVIGTDNIKEIVVVKNNQEYKVEHDGKKEIKVTWRDDNIAEGESYYYVRVMQEDGNLAWSSPIWATKE
jgi:hypothetical protein